MTVNPNRERNRHRSPSYGDQVLGEERAEAQRQRTVAGATKSWHERQPYWVGTPITELPPERVGSTDAAHDFLVYMKPLGYPGVKELQASNSWYYNSWLGNIVRLRKAPESIWSIFGYQVGSNVQEVHPTTKNMGDAQKGVMDSQIWTPPQNVYLCVDGLLRTHQPFMNLGSLDPLPIDSFGRAYARFGDWRVTRTAGSGKGEELYTYEEPTEIKTLE